MPNPPPFDRFGFFLTKNASREADLPLYTMYTGEGDPYKLSTIAAVDGSTNLGKNPHFHRDSPTRSGVKRVLKWGMTHTLR
jgi:hypothetical protein